MLVIDPIRLLWTSTEFRMS